MHLIAYQTPKDKGTICHGFKLKQHTSGHKKTRYDSGPSCRDGYGLFAAHNFPQDKGQD